MCRNISSFASLVFTELSTYTYWYIFASDYRSSYVKLHVSNVIVQIDIVWYIFETRLETKIFASWTKSILLRIYFRSLSVQRSCLQYKSQCLEKVNVKYVIKRSWHEIFHIVPGINPSPISALQLRCRAWYGPRVSG